MAFTPSLYSINEVNAVVDDYTIQAPAGDIPFETERTTPEDFTVKVGAKGDGTFVLQPDKSGVFIVRVKQNSAEDNTRLTALYEAQAIFATKFIGIHSYKEEASGQYCMIQQRPRTVFNSADEAEHEYRIVTTNLIETRK